MATDTVRAIIFDREKMELKVLDQTLLPQKINYVNVRGAEDGFNAIRDMVVRGAPCIAAVGCLSIIAHINHPQFLLDKLGLVDFMKILNILVTEALKARPTAVNLKNALDKLIARAKLLEPQVRNTDELIEDLTKFCLSGLDAGIALNKKLGDYGADELMRNVNERGAQVTILTHCNTGTLATVGYGTALGIVRSLRNKGALKRAYCTETRPYFQGARLTAWELVQEKIPSTLIADSMAASLMSTHKIDAVLVGADRVAANGDTANKIGTLQLALVAKHYGVPFYVAAPTQSFHLESEDLTNFRVEFRPPKELKWIGKIKLAPNEIDTWNACFDITPAALITGIVTEFGVCKPEMIKTFFSTTVDAMKVEKDHGLIF